jgi:transcriptional regulator with XRE-family HTH domain
MEAKEIEEGNRMISQHVGSRLKFYRKRKGYNQSEISTAIGLTRTSISNIETGRQSMTIETLLKCCAVLGCKPTDILPEVPKVKISKSVEVSRRVVLSEKVLNANFKW